MLGQMHGPTVVCHSCRFRSFQYLFPLNVFSSPRFPPPATTSLPPLSSSFSSSQPPLPSLPFSLVSRPSSPSPFYCAFLASTSLAQSPLSIGRFFFLLRHVITVSNVACTDRYRPYSGLGILFFTTFTSFGSFRDVGEFI